MFDLKKFTISNEEVHVWTIILSNQVISADEIKSILSYSELKKIDEFNIISDRERYFYYRGVLRLILSKYLDSSPENIIININKFGKPFIKNSKINFNISHKDNIAVIAITKDSNIGIDIEDIDHNIDYYRIVNRFFSEDERENFHILKPQRQRELFFLIWTMKEATVKALGKDIVNHFSKFNIKFTEKEIKGLEFIESSSETKFWFQSNKLFERYACSIVTVNPKEKIKYFYL